MAISESTHHQFEVTQDGMRLDEIVSFRYGSLQMFDEVLAANPNITAVHMNVGAIVFLPDVKPVKVDDVLW